MANTASTSSNVIDIGNHFVVGCKGQMLDGTPVQDLEALYLRPLASSHVLYQMIITLYSKLLIARTMETRQMQLLLSQIAPD